ncbi:hypothetical protein BC938DRAFT_472524, partial [Jimgerdemannia flammicorona]
MHKLLISIAIQAASAARFAIRDRVKHYHKDPTYHYHKVPQYYYPYHNYPHEAYYTHTYYPKSARNNAVVKKEIKIFGKRRDDGEHHYQGADNVEDSNVEDSKVVIRKEAQFNKRNYDDLHATNIKDLGPVKELKKVSIRRLHCTLA